MSAQEFLERLENPVRFRIREQMKIFARELPYYYWDNILSVSTHEREGVHECTITMRDTQPMEYIKKQILGHFTPSQDYNLVSGGVEEALPSPDSDRIYQFRFGVVEASNYE